MRHLFTPMTLVLALASVVAPAAAPGDDTPTPAGSPALESLLPSYDAARDALADDRLGGLAAPAHELRRAIAALADDGLTTAAAGVPDEKLGDVKALLPALRKASEALAAASSLPRARDAFHDLSKSLIAWRKLAGSGPDVGFCPMLGRSWLQAPGSPVENPYGGRSMAGCGNVAPPRR
ncbi:MAG TPA: hypothetical protein VGV61_17255 [Thermoanaerobaculia bacterium]|jgi:hypothetical protein|nr:hypothetical protein [Thermoanaerobaculia bacterium]